MSDRPNGAAPAAPASLPAPREHSEREVANVLAGLLDAPEEDAPKAGDRSERAERERARRAANDAGPESNDNFESDLPAEPDEGEEEDDVAADESPPSDDEPEGEDEATERPRHDPPAGWNAEDRKEWNSLPPKVQETIRRRDSEMAARLTRGTQEMAERERAWSSQIEASNADRDQYIKNLEVFRQVLLPEAQAFENVDWGRMAAEQPAEYVKLQHAYNAMREKYGFIQSEVQRIQQTQQAEQAQRHADARRFGHARLVEAMPEFADPQQAEKLGSELGAYLRKFGFSDHEISSVVDARAIQLAMIAMRAEQRQSATQRADTKRAPIPAPQVQRPGSSRRGEGDNARHRMTQLASRFDKSRSVKDAAAILAEWLP
jgi:hypothetical protein